MLTTTDNPFSPYTEFEQWNAYDMQVGHHTLSLLARVTRTSDELSDLDNAQAIDDAIEIIITEDVTELYKKATEPVSVTA